MAFKSILSPVAVTFEALGDTVASIAKTTKILDDMVEVNLEARKATKQDRMGAVIASHRVETMKSVEDYYKAKIKFQEKTGASYPDLLAELLD